MSKQIKGLLEKEFKRQFESLDEFAVVSVRGIDGVANNAFRGDLLQKDMRLMVVKNSLARRAFRDLGKESICDYLTGPSAIASGGDSIVDLVKALAEWDKKLDALQIKGAYLEGKVLDAKATVALSKLPNRVELQAMVVMITQSPGSRLVQATGSCGARIAGCIETLIKQKEEAA